MSVGAVMSVVVMEEARSVGAEEMGEGEGEVVV